METPLHYPLLFIVRPCPKGKTASKETATLGKAIVTEELCTARVTPFEVETSRRRLGKPCEQSISEAPAPRDTVREPHTPLTPACLQSSAVKPISVEKAEPGSVPGLRWRDYIIPKLPVIEQLGKFPLLAPAIRQSVRSKLEHPQCPIQPDLTPSV